MKPRIDIRKLEYATEMLKAVVHPTRIAIIDLLDQYGELTVTQMSEVLAVSHALMSHHLLDMKNKGILKSRRDGQRKYYAIQTSSILSVLRCIDHCIKNH